MAGNLHNSMKWKTVLGQPVHWVDLKIPPTELRPMNTLNMGQCFNWKSLAVLNEEGVDNEQVWLGIVEGRPMLVKQLTNTTLVSDIFSDDIADIQKQMYDYFQLSTPESLETLYGIWSTHCDRMRIITKCLEGVRVVRQDPWECLISFICSSNNNIQRITLMLNRLRKNYGKYLCSVKIDYVDDKINVLQVMQLSQSEIEQSETAWESQNKSPIKSPKGKRKLEKVTDEVENEHQTTESVTHHLYTFPTAEVLANVPEQDLRAIGMGYRAKFIIETSRLVTAKPGGAKKWFEKLRCLGSVHPSSSDASDIQNNRLKVQNELLELSGVGRKVADCVALFSLDQSEAIPVDTHVWSIAMRDYDSSLQQKKSLTPTVYEDVGNVFRKLFQKHAGWAHSVLFAAELPQFRKHLPMELQVAMKEFVTQQKLLKQQQKKDKNASKKVNTELNDDDNEDVSSIPR
jgi:3-methyladenine DNA glycosylase/8-oxoguanine DNA glycosylase